MRWIGIAAVIFLLACSGDSSSAPTTERQTTTSPRSECGGWRIGEVHDDPPECLPGLLDQIAASESVALTEDADEQAAAFCRQIGISGLVEAMALSFLEWDDGTKPSPAESESDFVPIAIAVYCPEHFAELQAL